MKKEDGFPRQISYTIPGKVLDMIKESPLVNDLYITDIGYYPEARFHFRKREVGISQAILIYSVAGRGVISVGGVKYDVKPDSFFLIPPDRSHSYYSNASDPWSIYWIHFAGVKASQFNKIALKVVGIDQSITSRRSDRIALFDEICRNLSGGFSISTIEYVNMCLSYLLASFMHIDKFRTVNEAVERDPVRDSINFMKENLRSKLKLEDLAAVVGLSPSHFSRLFNGSTGHSPIVYFSQLKIQHACRLLDSSDWSITEIASEMGFEDQFYFSRLFKKIMNISPRKYRGR